MAKSIKNVGAVLNRQHFSKEFKLEAVRLLELGQKPATNLTLDLPDLHIAPCHHI